MRTQIVQKVTEPLLKVFGPMIPKVKKASPEILLGVGIASIAGGTVLACKATLKAKEDVEDCLDLVETAKDHDVDQTAIRKMHLDTGFKVARHYALPVVLMGTGVACIVVSHNIQAHRLVAALASFDALQLSFEEYRRRVIEDQGPSADYRYLTGDKLEKATFYEKDETGKERKVKKEVKVRKNCADPYVKLFDECNTDEWKKERAFNLDFIQNQEVYFNRKLRMTGKVFLNEVYEALGFGYEPIGQFVGWMLGGDGDDHIVFEVEETYLPEEIEYAKEQHRNPEPSFWITFNVDGEIWDKVTD